MHSLHGMLARLDDEPWVTNPAISVKAENGVIWLWGQVASEPETGSDRDDGPTIPSCRGVANQLNVVASMPYDE